MHIQMSMVGLRIKSLGSTQPDIQLYAQVVTLPFILCEFAVGHQAELFKRSEKGIAGGKKE